MSEKGFIVISTPREEEEDHTAGIGFRVPRSGRPLVTWTLIIANVLVWVATEVSVRSQPIESAEVLQRFGAIQGQLIASGEYWRLFTAMFLHSGIVHLAFNCAGILIFGFQLEPLYGRVRFVLIYILSGLAGSVVSYALNISLEPYAIAVGASGALFGIIGGLVAFYALNRDKMGNMGSQNLIGLLILVGINLVFGLVTTGIDNYAHMGGLAAGFLIGLAFSPDFRPVFGPFGQILRVDDANSALRRWWVIPLTLIVLVAGTFIGNRNVGPLPDPFVSQAAEHRIEGEIGAALDALERAIEIDPTYGPAYLERARLMADMGNTDLAIADAARALRLGLSENGSRGAIELMVRLRGGR